MFKKLSLVLAAVLLFLAVDQQPLNAAKGRNPSDLYREYLTRAYYAKSLRSVANYFAESQREYYLSLEGAAAAKELKNIKKSYIANFRVIKEQTLGDMHYIVASGLAKDWGQVVKAKVRVEMIRETGGWKIMKHNWSGRIRNPNRHKKPAILR